MSLEAMPCIVATCLFIRGNTPPTPPMTFSFYTSDVRNLEQISRVPYRVRWLLSSGTTARSRTPRQSSVRDDQIDLLSIFNSSTHYQASTNFTSDDTGEGGFKRSIKWFKKWLEEQGHDSAVRVINLF